MPGVVTLYTPSPLRETRLGQKMTSVNVPDTVLAKIAADQSHSTTNFLLNNRTIFVQKELRIPQLRQK